MSEEPRELTPVQMFWDGRDGVKDFGPRVVHVSKEENDEAEAALTPAPKDESVAEFVDSWVSQPHAAPPASETPARPDELTPTEKLEAAVKESGKDSESSADAPTTTPPATPPPVPSSPSSSSATSPGKSTPPVVAKPPSGESSPAEQTTQK